MRGNSKNEEPTTVTPVIRTKKVKPIAVIVDDEGNTVYLIKSTMWANMVILLFMVIMLATGILAVFTFYNYVRVNEIQRELKIDD